MLVHRHPLPTQDILWCSPGLTDSVNALVALRRSFLAQAFATSPSLREQYCCGVSICRDFRSCLDRVLGGPASAQGDLQVSANLGYPSILSCVSSHALKLLK